MQVAIGGGTGVLGRALVPRLQAHGHRVRVLASQPLNVEFGSDAETLTFDLLSPSASAQLPDLLSHCDVVMHLATSLPRDLTAPEAWQANTRLRTEGTRLLLDAALAAGALDAPPGSVLNIGDEPLRSGDYMDRLAKKYRTPPPRRVSRPCPPSRRCSNRAAREAFAWAPLKNVLGD